MHSVLVIDDEDSLRTLLARWVDSAGYRAREADSAEEALFAMEREIADIALCDVTMAGRDGVWLASELRRLYPQTAIIMATGQVTSGGMSTMTAAVARAPAAKAAGPASPSSTSTRTRS